LWLAAVASALVAVVGWIRVAEVEGGSEDAIVQRFTRVGLPGIGFVLTVLMVAAVAAASVAEVS
jgi:hypothetical protein